MPDCNLPREITIPKGEYYMMGDNRGESADSREWGPVPKKWIIGKAFMTYWPPGRIGCSRPRGTGVALPPCAHL